jgi:hypothetical protein
MVPKKKIEEFFMLFRDIRRAVGSGALTSLTAANEEKYIPF